MWRQKKQDKEATCVEVRKFFMAHGHLSHQNQPPGLAMTMQIFPAVTSPCWTGRLRHPGAPHPATHTAWSAMGKETFGIFFLEIPSSCLTPSFLLTAHQRAAENYPPSTSARVSVFKHIFLIELRGYKTWQRQELNPRGKAILGELYPNNSGEQGG